MVDTGWHPPSAHRPSHAVDARHRGRRRAQRPRPAPVRRPRHVHRGRGALRGTGDEVFVEGFAIGGVGGGGILESDLVVQLEEALRHDPQVINLSAGCRTRMDLPSIALRDFHRRHLRGRTACWSPQRATTPGRRRSGRLPSTGASASGSLDRDGRVSEFSNYGVSADVYALGRNLVNAFPDGTFVCNETPDKGDVRVFSTGMARWSGTSFSAPVVAGLIAREISESGSSANDARAAVMARAVYDSDPTIGPHLELRQPYA